jgi:hypothetical protein
MYKFSKWFTDLNLPIASIHISCNPHPGAIEFLKANPQYINWDFISSNPFAMDLIHENPDKVNNSMLQLNPNSFTTNWFLFHKNTDIFSNFVLSDRIIGNKSMEAHEFILQHRPHFTTKNYYEFVSYNSFAFKHASQHEPHILPYLDSYILSENPEAVDFITTTPEKIYWPKFCKNPAAIPYIQCNTDKIKPSIWQNPGIFELDYQAMSIQRTKILLEELMEKSLHPSRIEYWIMNDVEIDDL